MSTTLILFIFLPESNLKPLYQGKNLVQGYVHHTYFIYFPSRIQPQTLVPGKKSRARVCPPHLFYLFSFPNPTSNPCTREKISCKGMSTALILFIFLPESNLKPLYQGKNLVQGYVHRTYFIYFPSRIQPQTLVPGK